MCSEDEKLILDNYVEGDFITSDLIYLIEHNSKLLDCEIYRGFSLPNFLLKVGNDINKYYPKKIMSFSKNKDIAKEFCEKLSIGDFIINALKKDGYIVDDDSEFTNVVIRLRNKKSLDVYDDYHNGRFEREREVLLITEPLFIQSITTENNITIIDCVDEKEFAQYYMIYL